MKSILKGSAWLFALCNLIASGSVAGADPWALAPAEYADPDNLRVLIVHDMEGLAGQDRPEQFFYMFPEYRQGQELLAGDVNAVAAGFFEGGAAEVHVVDGHGSGNPLPDLPPELLDPPAKQIMRPTPFGAYDGLADENDYDAVAIVGAHAKTGSEGFASHTMTLGMDVILNGRSVSETEVLALSWGRNGKPIIFVSGDDRLAADLSESMPWLELVVTKYSDGAGNARLKDTGKVRSELRAAAKRAIGRISEARAMKIRTPIEAALRAVPPASLRSMKNVPGVDYSEPGQTPGDAMVQFVAPDWESAMSGVFGLIAVARGGYLQSIINQYAREGDYTAFDRFYEKRMRVWIAQESGQLRPPPKRPDFPEPKRYHGVR